MRYWRADGSHFKCNRPGVALVTSGCVHEHLFIREPNCMTHSPGAMGCDKCYDADGHICELTDFELLPWPDPVNV